MCFVCCVRGAFFHFYFFFHNSHFFVLHVGIIIIIIVANSNSNSIHYWLFGIIVKVEVHPSTYHTYSFLFILIFRTFFFTLNWYNHNWNTHHIVVNIYKIDRKCKRKIVIKCSQAHCSPKWNETLMVFQIGFIFSATWAVEHLFFFDFIVFLFFAINDDAVNEEKKYQKCGMESGTIKRLVCVRFDHYLEFLRRFICCFHFRP